MKLAFVVQRAGAQIQGGAEFLCFSVAQKLAEAGHTVDILTTCAINYVNWQNELHQGVERLSANLCIKRFRVDQQRNTVEFDQFSAQIASNPASAKLSDCEKWMNLQGPISSDLKNYILKNQNEYDRFFFIPYLYATTYHNLPLVSHKSYLIPCAHDEWPFWFPIWEQFFTKPQKIIFNTPEEKELVQKRFPNLKIEGDVAGIGLAEPLQGNAESFRKLHAAKLQADPYLLYLGRIDLSKGIAELCRDFNVLKKQTRFSNLKLVLLGKQICEIPQQPDIIYGGFVDEQTKADALAGCLALVMPSPYESLSIVLLEAWQAQKPVAVFAQSDVLVGQCKRSNGGLWYRTSAEFCEVIKTLSEPKIAATLGRQGCEYVKQNYQWSTVLKAYLQ